MSTLTIDGMDPSVTRLLECAQRATAGLTPEDRRVVETADLKRYMNVSTAVLTNWKSRGVSKAGALEAARVFKCSASYILEGDGAPFPPSLTLMTGQKPVAQVVSLHAVQTPRPISWGELMSMKELPGRFSCEVPDDALAPHTPKGTQLIFETDAAPYPGHGVLVQDATGSRYVRRYIPGTAGRWTAAARNDAYPPMDSERDGLRLLAVATGRLDGAV